ncbi:hypothetical protein ACTACT_10175 [Pseudomonas syringae]|uniref:hypothetical protein n=1 Tax=Pseudomonas syringae TaxID=317 RepID=UPI003F7565B5
MYYLDIPASNTFKAFVKPVVVAIEARIDAWPQDISVNHARLLDERTREKASYLFQFRGKRIGTGVINTTTIPMLCAKAGVPLDDRRGPHYQPWGGGGRINRDSIGECSSVHVVNGADAVVEAQFVQFYAPLHTHLSHQAGGIICQSWSNVAYGASAYRPRSNCTGSVRQTPPSKNEDVVCPGISGEQFHGNNAS